MGCFLALMALTSLSLGHGHAMTLKLRTGAFGGNLTSCPTVFDGRLNKVSNRFLRKTLNPAREPTPRGLLPSLSLLGRYLLPDLKEDDENTRPRMAASQLFSESDRTSGWYQGLAPTFGRR
jgi:hypothetical protein